MHTVEPCDTTSHRFVAVLYIALGLSLFSCSESRFPSNLDLPATVDFNHHIRPILSQNCYVCHGPDASTREAGLRLDTREGALTKLENGDRAIVPGRPGQSLLLERIATNEAEERMPPPSSKKVLTPREMALLERWIEQGAEYKKHWSLIPPKLPTTPTYEATAPIDRFIGDRLQQQNLAFSQPASRETLLRRLSFVLTGLPPTPEEIQSYAADASSDAYEQRVDQYLKSPHFGERWARHWMDLMRYADSKGHEFDYTIEGSWRYRDYLIRAFNTDLPYDQFVKEHVAGDLLDSPRRHAVEGFNESVIGTAYMALGEGTHSPVDIRLDEADRIDNIIDVTTKSFQGLTVSCARCHDHKFDPIPTADYYALYGMFESTRFASTPLLPATFKARLDSTRTLQRALRKQLAARWTQELNTQSGKGWITTSSASQTQLSAPRDETGADLIGDFREGKIDGWYAQGPAFEHSAVRGEPHLNTTSMRIESLRGASIGTTQWPTGMPGALRSPTFTIEHDSLAILAAGQDASIRIVVDNFQLIRDPLYGGLETSVDDPSWQMYRFDLHELKGRKAYIELLNGVYDKNRHPHEHLYLITQNTSYIEAGYAVAYSDKLPVLPPPASAPHTNIQQALQAWSHEQATSSDITLINEYLSTGRLNVSLRPFASLISRFQSSTKSLEETPYVIAVTDGDRIESPVFQRGSHQSLGHTPIPHRFLSALRPDTTAFSITQSGRLEFADAIVDPANPLTARVMVNRLWHHVFGRGLVETMDNFGAQGKLPSHPELLDYLALQFVEQDWSMKAMIREMVLSETFRQSTSLDPAAQQADPQNLLLHHYPVRRLEAEAIRDAMLATSGQLDLTMYGPSIPVHLTTFMTGRGRPPKTGPLDGAGRRSLYTAIRRNFLSPMMLAFDMPIPFTTFGRRNTSNVPAQSLTLLNDPFVAEQAEHWAQALANLDGTTESKIEHLFLTALSRIPTDAERTDGLHFLNDQAEQLGLLPHQIPTNTAVWTAYCHAVFNFKEFIYLI